MPYALSLDLQLRNDTITRTRDAVRTFGRTHGFLASQLCGCGTPGCPNDDLRTMSLAAMLRGISMGWTEGGPEPDSFLRERLLAFSGTFDLDACPGGDPACVCNALPDADTRTVLRAVTDLWHGRAGNRVTLTGEEVAGLRAAYFHNLEVLDALARRLDPADAESFRAVLPRANAVSVGMWAGEARAMAAEAIASWLPAPAGMLEVQRVLDSALAIAYHGGWTTDEAAVFEGAAADACAAILARGIAHESVTEVLFLPFDASLALSDLDAIVDAETLLDAPLA